MLKQVPLSVLFMWYSHFTISGILLRGSQVVFDPFQGSFQSTL